MAEWWLLDERTQDALADHIDGLADAVTDHFDLHANEPSITAAFGQELLRNPFSFGATSVEFGYRNFPEQTEERATGADGGIYVSIVTPEEVIEKGVLFQAKRLPRDRPIRSQRLKRDDAERLRRQARGMQSLTSESIILTETRSGIYSVDAEAITPLNIQEAQRFPESVRLITIGTYLGKWVARCTRGELDPDLIRRMMTVGGFVTRLLTVHVRTTQLPLLTEGGAAMNPLLHPDIVPRWRR